MGHVWQLLQPIRGRIRSLALQNAHNMVEHFLAQRLIGRRLPRRSSTCSTGSAHSLTVWSLVGAIKLPLMSRLRSNHLWLNIAS